MMFTKPFRVKSNTAIKGSDRRKLRADVAAAFPSLSAEQLLELVPNKEELNIARIYAHKGDAVTVYICHRKPTLFELEKCIYPTVYTLWTCPDLLPIFTTWPAVLQKLTGGADLMLPGVVVPSCGLPEVQQGALCAISVVGNRAPVAIGIATMSSAEMIAAGMKGKGLTVLHTYLDQLWAFGDKSNPPLIALLAPETAEPSVSEEEEDVSVESHISEDCTEVDANIEALTICAGSNVYSGEQKGDDETGDTQSATEVEASVEECQEVEEDDGKTPQEQMDELLWQCFLHALKSKVKKSELPLLTSTFLRSHMYSCCPKGKTLDIKKSSYKKFSKFLQSVQQQNIVQVKELSKGVESIVDINWTHNEIRSFTVSELPPDGDTTETTETPNEEKPYHPPEIVSIYSISARLLPLFQDSQHKKGDILSGSDVRNIITNYVKSSDLVNEQNKNLVSVDPVLCDCLLNKGEQHEVTQLRWDELFTRCLERMQPCHQVTFPGHAPIIRKGNIEPVEISIAQRGSNKKITLVKNLELYGLDPEAVANIMQHRVQASTTISPVPGSKDRVLVQIQGNQVNHVGKLLLDEYRIPRKYVQGLEKAPKPAKKK
ncbi:eukaryotic translation initiation factor 2D [Protopterus annectens]|uniref:eukaryotic translation initiation factor 2D n=1 Tax=Protopterus annectens TaxID=7888 RepID=UPI001CFC3376|nr:eukaryotic translation initiation factor 2D [Protopterus annectens]